MKNTIKTIIIAIFVSAPLFILAQPSHPNGGSAPTGGNTPVGGGAPIASGLGILVVLGAAYGGKKVYDFKNKQK